MLINNDFVFLPIPKNASTSIIYSVMQWGIKVDFGNEEMNTTMLQQINNNQSFMHYHTTYYHIKNMFPNKKIIGIKRPSADRFLSALKHMILMCRQNNVELKYDFAKLNESEIITIFTEIINQLSIEKIPIIFKNELKEYSDIIYKIVKENITENYLNFDIGLLNNFYSQYAWGLNECDIILDISELNKFTDMIKNIKPNFNLIKMNDTNNITLNIKKSDKFIEFVDKIIDYK
jgi:hypothetical protein